MNSKNAKSFMELSSQLALRFGRVYFVDPFIPLVSLGPYGAWKIYGKELCWVQDTGAGIDFERLDKIFEKLETDQQPEKRGVGLGLTIVKQIVELHGGTIAVESRVGEGSTFTFGIPQPIS